MSLRQLAKPKAFERPDGFQWDAPTDVLAKWVESPHAAEADDPNTISIYDVIGEDDWTGGGFTARRLAAALRSVGASEVTVKINSPGGDMFEGLAIYNLLAEHPAKVTVDVMGIAASAASVIAMAGDEIRMGLGSFVMIHNAWGGVIGNRNDFVAAAEIFESFDGALADVYEARSGMNKADILTLMDADTYMGAKDALAKGFADTLIQQDQTDAKNENTSRVHAKRLLDASLAQTGMPRSERRRLLKEVAGTRDAAEEVTQNADLNIAAVQQFVEQIRS